MKIAFLHLTMGLVERGSEIATDQLAAGLSKKHEVLVIQSGPVAKKPYQVKQVYPLDSPPASAPSNIIDKIFMRLYFDHGSRTVQRFTEAARSTLAKFKPDIIVATNGLPQLQLLRGFSSKSKIVVFGHAGIGYHDLDSLQAGPDLFIALSPAANVWALSHRPARTRVVYIPNAIDIPGSKFVKTVDLGIPSPVVIAVGALSRYKNIDRVIEAVRGTSVSLLLIGDGEEHDHIAEMLASFPNDFRWIHQIDHRELGPYYAAADVFCFVPDPQESFGMVYLEAMAAGLPIVAAGDPIRRELVGKQGIYVDPQNLMSISAGINQALSRGKIDYSHELEPYKLDTVIHAIKKEFHDLV